MRERGTPLPQAILVGVKKSVVAVYAYAVFCYSRFLVTFAALREIVCIRGSHRSDIPSERENNSRKNRRIDDLSPQEAYRWTRFTQAQLRLLLVHLRMPEVLPISPTRCVFTGEEVLIVCLTRIATGDAFYDFIPAKFGGSAAKWSYAFKWFIDHVFLTFYHKITGNSMLQWSGYIDSFRTLIANKVAEVPVSIQRVVNGVQTTLTYRVNCDVETFRVFGFIDDTGVPTCIPGGSGLGFINTLQRAFYR
jgi:hypothetical protein